MPFRNPIYRPPRLGPEGRTDVEARFLRRVRRARLTEATLVLAEATAAVTADRAEGVEEPKALTEAQKERIAELRREARAGLAELEIFRAGKIAAAAGDPEKLAEIEEHDRIDRERIQSRMEAEIRKVRG